MNNKLLAKLVALEAQERLNSEEILKLMSVEELANYVELMDFKSIQPEVIQAFPSAIYEMVYNVREFDEEGNDIGVEEYVPLLEELTFTKVFLEVILGIDRVYTKALVEVFGSALYPMYIKPYHGEIYEYTLDLYKRYVKNKSTLLELNNEFRKVEGIVQDMDIIKAMGENLNKLM